MAADPLTVLVRKGLEEACRAFTVRIAPSGFSRTKKMFWARVLENTAEVIHFHRCGSTYGKPIGAEVEIRIHLAIRVLNDPSHTIALNGPSSDPGTIHEGRYHLRFNAKSGSMLDRCVDDLVRFVGERGEPWFHRFREPDRLVGLADSPLQADEREALRSALSGLADADRIRHSKSLLGIADPAC